MDKNFLSFLCCPRCEGPLENGNVILHCCNCKQNYPIIENLIVFLTPNDLNNFLKESWGKGLLKEGYGIFPNADESREKILEVINQARSEADTRNLTDEIPHDPNMPPELEEALEKSRSLLFEMTKTEKAKIILDWPTGPGIFLKYLMNKISAEQLVVALDINLEQLARTKAYFDQQDLGDNILFVVADARKMPFKDNQFQAVTAWGGTSEISSPELGVKETYRVLQTGGWFGLTGDQYKEDSPSMKVAQELGLDTLLTEDRLRKVIDDIGFRNFESKVIYQGHDIDLTTPIEERCPLPAPGDWFSHIVASAQK